MLAPEVVQTSAMDCGPAALKCVLEGHGVHVSYGRLRDACQTDVDGTSIDTMESVGNQLGLRAEQIVVPADHLLLPEAAALPAIVVVQLSQGLTHFVVAWRRHGRMVQVMDPASGRRWVNAEQLLTELYLHRMIVPAAGWREWAGSSEFQDTLTKRVTGLGARPAVASRAIEQAASDASYAALATLDAVTRMVQSLVGSGGLRRGAEAVAVLQRLNQQIRDEPTLSSLIPERYWSVRPAEPDVDGTEQLALTGAVLVRFRGKRIPSAPEAREETPLSDSVAATLHEAPVRPFRELVTMLRADRALSIPVVVAATALASVAVVVEALLFRSLLDIGRDLGVSEQRLAAIAGLIAFTLLLTSSTFRFPPGCSRPAGASRRGCACASSNRSRASAIATFTAA